MATSMRKLPLSILLKTNGFHLCCRSAPHGCCRTLQTASDRNNQQDALTKTSGTKQIIFPKRKNRDALSVLKCLAATVQKDPTAPDYIYVDDPFLYPDTMMSKKEFAMSKSAGRKAARYFVNNYPEIFKASLFNEEAAVPAIPEFMPKKINYEKFEANEDALLERIEMRRAKDAIDMYNEIQDQGLDLSQETRLSLLHLLCVFNSQDPPEEGNPEDIRYSKSPRQYTNTWKKESAAEQVFADLPEKTSEAYCSLIRGMAKFLNAEQAFELYNEALNKNLDIDVGTFNSLLLLCRYQFMTDNDAHWNTMLEILKTMKKHGVAPNEHTFLNMYLSFKACKRLHDRYLFHMLNEMKALNMDPPLGIYYMVMEILYKDKSKTPEHPFLSQLLDFLQNKPLELRTAEDVDFFISGMTACTRSMYDLSVAHKLVDLLQSRDNEKFIVYLQSENSFWHKYFSLVCELEGLDKIMEIYERIVPNRWGPSYQLYEDIFRAIELYEGYHYLPQIRADMTVYRFTNQTSISSSFFELVAKRKHPEELQTQFLDIMSNEMKNFYKRQQTGFLSSVNLSGEIIGHFIVTSIHGNRLDLAMEYLNDYMEHRTIIQGKISPKALEVLIEECIKQKDEVKAMECLQFMSGEGHPKIKTYQNKVKALGDK